MRQISSKEIIAYLKSNKLHRDPYFSLQRLSNQLDCQLDYISQAILNETGQEFLEFLLQQRVMDAKEMLCRESFFGFTIEAVGRMSGFKNRLHFEDSFRAHTGYKPDEYRRLRTSRLSHQTLSRRRTEKWPSE